MGDFLGKTSIHTNNVDDSLDSLDNVKKNRFPSCHWRGDADDLCMAKPYVEDGVRRAHVSKPCMMDVSTTKKVTQEWWGSPQAKQWNALF